MQVLQSLNNFSKIKLSSLKIEGDVSYSLGLLNRPGLVDILGQFPAGSKIHAHIEIFIVMKGIVQPIIDPSTVIGVERGIELT
jgi:hypothetical protein